MLGPYLIRMTMGYMTNGIKTLTAMCVGPISWQQTSLVEIHIRFKLRQMLAHSISGFLRNKEKEQVSDNHIYLLVDLRCNRPRETMEYFIVPSKVISEKMVYSKNKICCITSLGANNRILLTPGGGRLYSRPPLTFVTYAARYATNKQGQRRASWITVVKAVIGILSTRTSASL